MLALSLGKSPTLQYKIMINSDLFILQFYNKVQSILASSVSFSCNISVLHFENLLFQINAHIHQSVSHTYQTVARHDVD